MLKNFLLKLPRNFKRFILMSVDFITLSLAVWIALIIRSGNYFVPADGYALTNASAIDVYITIFMAPLIAIPVLAFFRLYRSITRYITIETYKKITKALFIAGIIWASLVYMSSFPIPRSAFPIYIILSIITVYYTRFTARNFLLSKQYIGAKNVLIYGIDSSSIQISEILRADPDINPVGFINDTDESRKTSIAELPVYNKKSINKIIVNKNITEILITVKNQSHKNLRKIVYDLAQHQNIIRKLPNIGELASGKARISDVKRINIEDLLGRDAVKPDPYLLRACIENKTVLITGCGGSIGSELARQIIRLNPKKIL